MIARLRARLMRTADASDRGITLVELLVASMVTVVLLALAFNLFLTGSVNTSAAHYQNTDTGTASNVINEVSSAVRFGTDLANSTPIATAAIVSAGKEWLVLYSYVHADRTAPAPVMVEFLVDPGTRNVVEKTWSATQSPDGFFLFPTVTDHGTSAPTVAAAPQTSRVLGGPLSVTPSGGNPLFSYSGTSGAIAWANAYETSTAQTSLALISTVSVDVRVATDPSGSAPPVELYGSAALQQQGIGA